MTVHKLKESIAARQAGRQEGRGQGQRGERGAAGVVHQYHGKQFCAQPNKIRDVIIISLLDVKWEEAAFGFFFSILREKKADGQSHQSHFCGSCLIFWDGGLEAGLQSYSHSWVIIPNWVHLSSPGSSPKECDWTPSRMRCCYNEQ